MKPTLKSTSYEADLEEYFDRYEHKYDYFNLFIVYSGVDQQAADNYFSLYKYWQGRLIAFFPDMNFTFERYREAVGQAVSLLDEITVLDEEDTEHVAYVCGTHFVQPEYPPPVWLDPEHELQANIEFTFPELCVGDNTHESWRPMSGWWQTILEFVATLLGHGDAVTITNAGLAAQNVLEVGSEVFEYWCAYCLCEIEIEGIPEEWQYEDCIEAFCLDNQTSKHCPGEEKELTNAKQKWDAIIQYCPAIVDTILGIHEEEAEEELTVYWSDQLDE